MTNVINNVIIGDHYIFVQVDSTKLALLRAKWYILPMVHIKQTLKHWFPHATIKKISDSGVSNTSKKGIIEALNEKRFLTHFVLDTIRSGCRGQEKKELYEFISVETSQLMTKIDLENEGTRK